MILSIYVGFWILTLFFLVYGYYTKSDMHCIIAYTFMFLLGGALEPALPGTVEYKTGYTEFDFHTYGAILNSSSHHWDATSGDPSQGPPQQTTTSYLFHINNTVEYTYDTYESHFYGFWIMIMAAFGIVFTMVQRRRQADEDEGVENYA